MAKKDTGIATLPNGIQIREELRDQLLKRDWNKHTEGGYKPVADATTKNLKEQEFSGYRVNEFTAEVELWILGRIAVRRKCAQVQHNMAILAEMHEEAFATNGSVVMADEGENNGTKLH